ncbi:tetratricopeptide repeat protein [Polynucleobacter sp. MWH-UH24A]|uniref:tetratricopeptide repeat protein n=1 Tax=Polynucleobacter sp. MWH-UH24A TaxID=2689110 RepID=UPI001BFE1DF6|nr:tetratricopeptide repeat protein [Polynucleobacter sp. MWH-UH24A]QWD75845.1 tetratricopeptide repeat protein [Polynucleobacter sp. MWH-UH24A]
MNSQTQIILQQAIQAFQVGNLESADLMLKRVLQIDSKNLPALHILGLIKASQCHYKEAVDYLGRALRIHPNDASIHYNLAKVLSESGNDKDALINHKMTVALAPSNPEAWLNYGKSVSNLGYHDEALNCFNKALSLKPNFAEALLNKGAIFKELKKCEEALAFAEQALSINPNLVPAWAIKGVTLHELKRYDEAIAHYDKALSLKPDYHEAWANKGVTLHELKRYDEAIAHYDKALSLKPDYHEAWVNKGATLNELKRYDEAIAHYDKALSLKPDYHEAWANKGVTLHELKRYDEAIAHYDKALSLKSTYAESWAIKGVTLHELKRYDEAIAHYDKALSLKPDYHEAWANKGATLNELKRYDEAIAHYEKAQKLNPDVDWILGDLLHIKMKVCDWSSLDSYMENIAKKIKVNQKVIHPFNLLGLIDDAFLHKKCSEIYAQHKYPANPILGPIPKLTKRDKIRIAYFSPDFRNHPVSFLTSELFEIHDRKRFEVYAFSLQKASTGDEMNLRLRKVFDRFIDTENMLERDIAKLARELEIDIAIDLAGSTQYSKTKIFSHRAAPIQVNWLGYPGTIGTDFIDYIVADKTIIPDSHQHFYSEKVVHLPDTYIVDDSTRVASSRIFTREECKLPRNAFVFCCFNNDYKFNYQVLDSWSRILKQVRNSVLWVSENNEYFRTNLVTEFESRGLESSRIIFAKREELMADHLARYKLADLFLDTSPYNAHTTAVDSLKSGVPVLTLLGESFASRVASSLLNTIGLPELIKDTQETYEAMAIDLAKSPQKLASIKEKLVRNRLSSSLFDTKLFAKNLETAYIKMYERYQADLQPDYIVI